MNPVEDPAVPLQFHRFTLLLTLVGATGLGMAGCDPVTAPPDSLPVRIEFPDGPVTIAVDRTHALVVRAWDGEGRPVESPPVAWASSQPAVARVDASGLVTGVSPGRASISAAWQGVTATVQVQVQKLWLTTIPGGPPMLAVGGGGVLVVAAHFDDGSGTPPDFSVTWSAPDPGIARIVLAAGVVAYLEGAGSGVSAITARVGDLTASLAVEVFGPLPSGAPGITLLEAHITELGGPFIGSWEYAPAIQVAAESAPVQIVRIRGVFPGQGPWPPFCASISLPPFGSGDLFRERQGYWELAFSARDWSRAPAGSGFPVSIDFRTGLGGRGTLSLELPVRSGELPGTFTPGALRWVPCHQGS